MIVEVIMDAAKGQEVVQHITNKENDVGQADKEEKDEGSSWVL